MPTGPTPLDKSQPGSNQHPLSTKEEARAGEKEKPRAEDSGLDSVAARTVSDHMPVKQEPLVPSVRTCEEYWGVLFPNYWRANGRKYRGQHFGKAGKNN